MRTRKLMLLGLAILVVFGLLALFIKGCVSSAPETLQAELPAPTAPVKITFWNQETNDRRQEVLKESIQTFNQTHPHIQIVPYFYEGETYKAKLRVATISGKMPDLFYYWTGESFKYIVDSQIAADLTDLMEQNPAYKKQFYPESLQNATYYERLYGLPHTTTHVVFWYNKRLFAQYGIKPPDTWDELMADAERLLSKGITPFTVSGKDRWPLLNWYAYLSNRLGGSSPFQYTTKRAGDFTDPSFIEAALLFRELIKKKMFVPGFLGVDRQTAESMFLKGEAAMYLQGDWAAEEMLSHPDIGYFRFPTVNGKGDPTVYYGGSSNGWAISKNSNQQAAFEVLTYMLSIEERKKFVETSGQLSTLKGIPLSPDHMKPSIYEYVQFIEKDPSNYFGYYDQEIDPRRSELLLDAVVTMAGAQSMSRKEIEDLLKQIR
ncbi:raffinose/stachyose/melibiose transport system substrate-binding protein [Paenibacillus sp. 1_12]|uniref:ABC transporter substrate-binding protein n=1 Tax=Paenibacillus sp. 1_12 TaxID=1566278 RepID=UPI0008E7B321|nr:extracellular solute-binding protein [Paenibacillus sp. 1_12]SFK98263.1 raffinose/stachyose/melibiose transport system substrate-binding protein [Paenibacillus sp. 1_12]